MSAKPLRLPLLLCLSLACCKKPTTQAGSVAASGSTSNGPPAAPSASAGASASVVAANSSAPPAPLTLSRTGTLFLAGKLKPEPPKEDGTYLPPRAVWIERDGPLLAGVLEDELGYGRKVEGRIEAGGYSLFYVGQPQPAVLTGPADNPGKGTLAVSWIDSAKDYAIQHGSVGFSLEKAAFSPRTYRMGGLVGSRALLLTVQPERSRLRGVLMGNDARASTVQGMVSDDGRLELTESDASGELARWSGIASDSVWLGHRLGANGTSELFWFNEGVVSISPTVDLGGGFGVAPRPALQFFPACYVDHVKPMAVGPGDSPTKLNALFDALDTASEDRGSCLDNRYASYGLGTERPNRDSLDYEVVALGAGRFSLRLHFYADSNGAHGMAADSCLVGDASTGRLVDLREHTDKQGREKLTALVEASFRKQYGKKDLTEAGFFSDAAPVGEGTSLCVTKSGVEVRFGQYEIGPYMMGMPAAEIPKAKLRGLFARDPLLDAVLEN